MTRSLQDDHLKAGAWAACGVNLSSRNMLYQLSYPMLIEKRLNANLIVYVDVIMNQAEYQYKV